MAVATLGEAYSAGWRLKLICREGKGGAMKKHRACVASIEVDVETLLWTHGRDCDLAWLAQHLKCPHCNSRRVVIYFVPPTAAASQVIRA